MLITCCYFFPIRSVECLRRKTLRLFSKIYRCNLGLARHFVLFYHFKIYYTQHTHTHTFTHSFVRSLARPKYLNVCSVHCTAFFLHFRSLSVVRSIFFLLFYGHFEVVSWLLSLYSVWITFLLSFSSYLKRKTERKMLKREE